MKSIYRLILGLTLSVGIISCQREEPNLAPSQSYPDEITMDNWEEFVDAPQELLDELSQRHSTTQPEMKLLPGIDPAVSTQPIEKSVAIGGKMQLIGYNRNPSNHWFPNTGVRFGPLNNPNFTHNTFSSPDSDGFNYYASGWGGYVYCEWEYFDYNNGYSASKWLAGVTVNDIVRVQRHILGTEPFTEGWQYLAADVNGDGYVDVIDIVAIQRLILGYDNAFPQQPGTNLNQPVFFIPKSRYESVTNNSGWTPTAIMNVYTQSGLTLNNSSTGQHWYAIKRGDLDGSWNY